MCPQEATRSLAVPKEESWRFPPATDSVGLDVSWTCSELRWKKNLHRFFESFMGQQKNLQAKRSDSFVRKRFFSKSAVIFVEFCSIGMRLKIGFPQFFLPFVGTKNHQAAGCHGACYACQPGHDHGSTICQVWNAWFVRQKMSWNNQTPIGILVKQKWCQQCN